ncbi:MAG: GNAT family N-acetyltransferase [Ilumatobacteraceae bacterium]
MTNRRATRSDADTLRTLADASIAELQRDFLTEDQIEASRAIMGIDSQLIDDGTYFMVEINGQLAGCGGWSRRATLYGGDETSGRNAALLDPRIDPARVRAMYTSPAFARRGVGRRILELCEADARAEGFSHFELMATMSGRALYESYGFVAIEEVVDDRSGVPVPLVRMGRTIDK